MQWPIRRTGETGPGTATVTLERDGTTLVVRGVLARAGVKADVRDHVAA